MYWLKVSSSDFSTELTQNCNIFVPYMAPLLYQGHVLLFLSSTTQLSAVKKGLFNSNQHLLLSFNLSKFRLFETAEFHQVARKYKLLPSITRP